MPDGFFEIPVEELPPAKHMRHPFISLFRIAAIVAFPAVCVAQTIYVSETGNYSVDRFSPAGVRTVVAGGHGFALPFTEPYGMAFDSGGNLYVADGYSDTIQRISPDGALSMFANTGLSIPTGLAFDASGNLYAANWLNGTIERFTPNGVGSVFVSGLQSPWGLAFDAAGNLYVAGGVDNTIRRFAPDGTGSVFATVGVNGPFGLAFDSAGNLFVANQSDNAIERFTPGGVGSVFANTGLSAPSGLTFDAAGNLYVTSQADGKIINYTPGGQSSVFASGLQHPTFIAAMIPEPSTLSLLGGVAAFLSIRSKLKAAS